MKEIKSIPLTKKQIEEIYLKAVQEGATETVAELSNLLDYFEDGASEHPLQNSVAKVLDNSKKKD